MQIKLPEILKDSPPKLLPFITKFKDYKYFLLHGGRGSGKTQTVARMLLYLGDYKDNLTITCGREEKVTIEESVHTVLSKLIDEYNLAFDVMQVKIPHKSNKSVFKFKGLKDHTKQSIKGFEGTDILWVDEAQTITKGTLDILIPTIRRPNSKIIFTMNRLFRKDPAYLHCINRNDALVIHCNYTDNPMCPETLKVEARRCLEDEGEEQYNHIWLGYPKALSKNMLFSTEALDKCRNLQPVNTKPYIDQSVLGIDIAASGEDLCVASEFSRVSDHQWKLTWQEHWDDSNTMASVGRIVAYLGQRKPTLSVIDVGGLGTPVYQRLKELGIKNLYAFNGSNSANDNHQFYNRRAEIYFAFRDMVNWEHLIIDSERTLNEMELIKYDYKSSGKKLIQPKAEMEKSPDFADSAMMAIYGIRFCLAKQASRDRMGGSKIKVVNKRRQHQQRRRRYG